MKNSKIFVYAALALSAFGMQSCLDYDTPGDEFNANQTIVPPVLSSGKADVIEYDKTITDAGVEQACIDHLRFLREHAMVIGVNKLTDETGAQEGVRSFVAQPFVMARTAGSSGGALRC